MEKIGIICEDFKLAKFEEEFKKAKITYEIRSNENGIVAIAVLADQSFIKPIIEKVTQYFIDQAKIKLN